jgi:UDP-2,3-diacylglucosamine pyrophosphatase LpxH
MQVSSQGGNVPVAAESGPTPAWDLLLFSDVHLGSDLRRSDLAKEGSLDALRARDGLDRALGSLLDHYAEQPPEGRRWRLILAGDIVDFIGINLTPSDVGERAAFDLTAEEQEHGLEPGPERCAWMMQLVLRRHPRFFRRLAAFLAHGNDMVIVRGNHDAALLWPEVQQTLVNGVIAAADEAGLGQAERGHIAQAVKFEDWFYLEPGRIYVEHGHLHDSYSSDPNARSVQVQRPDRLTQPVSTLMLRYFGNKFPTLDLDTVDQWSAWDYLRWAFVVENPFKVAAAWVSTVTLLLLPFWRRFLRSVRRMRAQRAKDAVEPLDTEEEVTGEVELASRVRAKLAKGAAGAEKLAVGLARLVRRAACMDVQGILQVFFLDRIAVLGGGLAMAALCLLFPSSLSWRLGAACAVLAGALLVDRRLAGGRQVSIAPKLHAAAEALSKLIEVPLVVMGHSHKAVDTVLGDGRTRYVNLGSWISASRPAAAPEAGCPHLVLREHRAQFVRARLSELLRVPAR